MDASTTSLFAPQTSLPIGVAYHNIGSGVLRASHADTIRQVSAHYGERCGHLPLDAERIYVLIPLHSPAIDAQIAYLSTLIGKTIMPVTETELRTRLSRQPQREPALFVPYINVPQDSNWITETFHGTCWGLPSAMVDVLKNKASFYGLLDEFDLADWRAPEYRVAQIDDLPSAAYAFLGEIETLLSENGLAVYPPGVMLRAAESDGNYGSCLLYQDRQQIVLVPNGDPLSLTTFPSWQLALDEAQQILLAAMDTTKESRVVISRYLDLAESPGLSLLLLNGEVVSLGWNGQLQEPGSKACVGTGSYQPPTEDLAHLREQYEPQTVELFTTLLQKVAAHRGFDFSTLRGLANIDIMLPGPLEVALQQRLGRPTVGYIAECNPRWTNYTDAIMMVIGAQRQSPTAQQMQATIAQGILALDKYKFPSMIDTQQLRARIADADQRLKDEGTRIICRMATHPLGVIFAGDLQRARRELDQIVVEMTGARK